MARFGPFELDVIGRDPGCRIPVNSAGVSRRHARIVVSSHSAAIEDLGSKNGTTVGGERLTHLRHLEDGDQLGFGSVRAFYRCSAAGLPTETHAARPGAL